MEYSGVAQNIYTKYTLDQCRHSVSKANCGSTSMMYLKTFRVYDELNVFEYFFCIEKKMSDDWATLARFLLIFCSGMRLFKIINHKAKRRKLILKQLKFRRGVSRNNKIAKLTFLSVLKASTWNRRGFRHFSSRTLKVCWNLLPSVHLH